ncbi:heptaprenyl diphosphate synthase [Bacillus mesophilus]|uniref:Heptaprenyl diphosphate synthase component 2 n=1 Tax=Bacillus mesophilus TaxID=1808955 RepID=A0A6M0Q702_9BACI|nr:heptaprenyl diphosphate synthase component II [Bacillus mesophilus]MBM7661245.1 heptaprenyl diphosphate synthase [Bacillus mesophilus]NEY71230.1 heptaprenyl diphosphate synthase component II [Bacillus mesophilus]
MKLNRMYSFLNTDLKEIEKELQDTIKSEHPLLQEASLHTLQAGGKRLRPVFVLLAGKFGNYKLPVIKNVAVALELIHMASLVHDDVIDDAELRRGQPTIKSKWDNRIAMYTGDYIFARSLELMTNIDNPEAHKILSHSIVEVSLGEIEQIRDKYNFDQHLKTYLRRIKRKTALLIAVSCQLGAVASDAPREIHEKLFLFGYYVGMSFQIIDDILDFTSTEKELGKPVGDDLRQGNITLPVLLAMKDDKLRAKIEDVNEHISDIDMKSIILAIKESGSIEQSIKYSDWYLQKALKTVEQLPNNTSKIALINIAKYIGKRKF